jgi:hypothetical protein
MLAANKSLAPTTYFKQNNSSSETNQSNWFSSPGSERRLVGGCGFTPAVLIILTAEPQIGQIFGSKELKFYLMGNQIRQAHLDLDILFRQG